MCYSSGSGAELRLAGHQGDETVDPELKEEVEKEERRDVKINERDCRGRVSEIEVGCVPRHAICEPPLFRI